MHDFLGHPFFQELLSLKMPADHFVIAGSGPLFVRGLITDLGDLDVVARDDAWKIATNLASPGCAPYADVRLVRIFGGDIEILDGWFPDQGWNVDVLIDTADVMLGLRFMRLEYVLATKQLLKRPRDLVHVQILNSEGWGC